MTDTEDFAADRPATRDYKKRVTSFRLFFSKKHEGNNFKKDFAEWADTVGLCTRTATEYLTRARDREWIKVEFDNSWKWTGPEYSELQMKIDEQLEDAKLKVKLHKTDCFNIACKPNTLCKNCQIYANLCASE